MYKLLIQLMLGAVILELGIGASRILVSSPRDILKQVDSHSKTILIIKWKPISVFPEEAKRFR